VCTLWHCCASQGLSLGALCNLAATLTSRVDPAASMSPPAKGPALPLAPSFACSAIAACIAEATTLPLDTAKVRLQMQGGLLKPGETPKYRCVRAPTRCTGGGTSESRAGQQLLSSTC